MSMDIFLDMGMRKKNFMVVWIFWVGHGQILVGHWKKKKKLTWNFLLVMRSVGTKFWDVVKFLLGMGFFFFFFFWSILEWVFCEHLDDWPTSFCRTSRVEIASKCWKAYERYCLRRLRTSLMKQASRLFSELYWIRIVMSTKISNYSFLCQSSFGILRALSIFQALVKWCCNTRKKNNK